MCKPSLLHALTLIASISIMVAPTLADSPGGGLGLFGGVLDSPVVQQCLTGVLGIQGCLQELMSSVLTLQPRLLGPACCKAFVEINESCWPRLFPFNLAFPTDLKNYCAVVIQPPPPPPPPPSCSDGGDYDGDCYDG